MTLDPLDNWKALNTILMVSDRAACEALLKRELRGRARRQFLLRIHSRINKVRADEEREALNQKATKWAT